jgi:hypothetical protein
MLNLIFQFFVPFFVYHFPILVSLSFFSLKIQFFIMFHFCFSLSFHSINCTSFCSITSIFFSPNHYPFCCQIVGMGLLLDCLLSFSSFVQRKKYYSYHYLFFCSNLLRSLDSNHILSSIFQTTILLSPGLYY